MINIPELLEPTALFKQELFGKTGTQHRATCQLLYLSGNS